MTPGKKKGPPKKAARKHPHPGGAAMKAVVDAAAQLVDVPPSKASLRWRASVYYTTDVNQCSTSDMAEMPEFAGVGLSQLLKWCSTDKWVDERKAFLERVQQKIELAITDKVVQRRIELLEKIRPVLDSAVETFLPHEYVFGDLDEKATWKDRCRKCGRPKLGHENPFYGETGSQRVSALDKLITMDLSLSEVVMRSVAARTAAAEGTVQNGSHGDHPPLSSNLTTEEARVAAHAVIRQRREKTLGPAASDVEDGDDDGEADAPD